MDYPFFRLFLTVLYTLAAIAIISFMSGVVSHIVHVSFMAGQWGGKLAIIPLIALPLAVWETKRENRRLFGK
jgi:hypothetical protein